MEEVMNRGISIDIVWMGFHKSFDENPQEAVGFEENL